ncbi:hypothetical protein [Glycocaulis sp.]|uniref:hypothetical protein n=1 Tax=Glycocaulis sp. TaxID=1969725 RepID=UPI003D23674C
MANGDGGIESNRSVWIKTDNADLNKPCEAEIFHPEGQSEHVAYTPLGNLDKYDYIKLRVGSGREFRFELKNIDKADNTLSFVETSNNLPHNDPNKKIKLHTPMRARLQFVDNRYVNIIFDESVLEVLRGCYPPQQ